MEKHAAAISKAGRRRQDRDMDEMSSIQADMWDNALMARAESAEVARQSAEIERLAAEVRGMAEAMARRSAARAEREAAAAVVRGRDGGRDAQEGRREGGGEGASSTPRRQYSSIGTLPLPPSPPSPPHPPHQMA